MENRGILLLLAVLGFAGTFIISAQAFKDLPRDLLEERLFYGTEVTPAEAYERLQKLAEIQKRNEGKVSNMVAKLLEYNNTELWPAKCTATDAFFFEMVKRMNSFSWIYDRPNGGIKPYVRKCIDGIFTLCHDQYYKRLQDQVAQLDSVQRRDLDIISEVLGISDSINNVNLELKLVRAKDKFAEVALKILELRDTDAFQKTLKKPFDKNLAKTHCDMIYNITESIYQTTKETSLVYIHTASIPEVVAKYNHDELIWTAKLYAANGLGGSIEFSSPSQLDKLYDAFVNVYKEKIGGSHHKQPWYKKLCTGSDCKE